MRTINLLTHCLNCKELEESQLKKINCYESMIDKSNVRRMEEDDLAAFVKKIILKNYEQYSHFFWNFSIPQISKEFDLLRIDEFSVLNIELKNFAEETKIRNQLLRNKYYLQSINKKIFLYCYTVNDGKLYYLDENELNICEDFEEIIKIIESQKNFIDYNIEDLFLPSHYLVSPFNKTKEFVNDEYFLNGQQEKIKIDTITTLQTSSSYELIALSGGAGSGKTLLIYDIAKQLKKENYKVTLIHCGSLNNGHKKLIGDFNWNIYQILDFSKIEFENIDILIIDEGQRVWERQLTIILDKIKNLNIKCIFSFDPEQVLNYRELHSNSLVQINENKTKEYNLTGKIRSNTRIISFIDNLFCLRNRHPKVLYDNIKVCKFNDYKSTKKYIEYLTDNGWVFINYTASKYYHEDFECLKHIESGIPHTVIGQEFDKVAVILDNKFYYDNNNLKSGGWKSNNNGEKMLYQSLTRAKSEVCLIIIENNDIFEKCIDILYNE